MQKNEIKGCSHQAGSNAYLYAFFIIIFGPDARNAINKRADQPAHPRSPINLFVLRMIVILDIMQSFRSFMQFN